MDTTKTVDVWEETVTIPTYQAGQPEIEVYQEDIALRNRLYCNYLRALGEFGLGNEEKAEALLCEILEEQADYQCAIAHLKLVRPRRKGKKWF
ncbi:MAG: hypothetical protein LUE92_00220 [Clostridiales bacterium]|nr:hypothetical protein [Clostridiales bacterium]